MREAVHWLVLFLLSAGLAYGATELSIVLSRHRGVFDMPNSRSSHSRPIPRIGGIGILAGFYLSIAALWILARIDGVPSRVFAQDFNVALLAAAGMAITGVVDDLYGLTPAIKFLMQFFLAALVVGFGVRFEQLTIPFHPLLALGIMSLPLTIFWLTGFSNVYNFMDGINGLAAGTGVVYGFFFFLLARWQGEQGLALLAMLLSASCLGFLFHNFPQARTFMGDTGSLFLGMTFAVLAVRLSQRSPNPASWAALLLICSVYLYDSTFTLLRRIKHRENILQAHRSHLYQRLAQAGLPHARITFWYLLLHILMGVLGLRYLLSSDLVRWLILACALLIFLAFTLGVYWFEHEAARSNLRTQGNPILSSN